MIRCWALVLCVLLGCHPGLPSPAVISELRSKTSLGRPRVTYPIAVLAEPGVDLGELNREAAFALYVIERDTGVRLTVQVLGYFELDKIALGGVASEAHLLTLASQKRHLVDTFTVYVTRQRGVVAGVLGRALLCGKPARVGIVLHTPFEFHNSLILAHEIGHLLCATHDVEGVMAETLDFVSPPEFKFAKKAVDEIVSHVTSLPQ